MTASTISKLDQPRLNILAIILSSGVLWGIYINADILENTGMAALILNWVPLIIGIVTMAFYGLSRLMTKKRNWIVSGIGIGLNLIVVISAFFQS